MEHNKQLTEYINNQLQRGVSEAEVHAALLESGWDKSMVDSAFAGIRNASLPQQNTPTPHPSGPQVSEISHNRITASESRPNRQTKDLSQQSETYPVTKDYKPPKYGIFAAISDTILAIKDNFVGFMTVSIAVLLLAYGGTFLIGALAASSLFLSQPGQLNLSLVSLIGMYFLLTLIVEASIFTGMAIVIKEGYLKSSDGVSRTIRKIARALPRVLVAKFLVDSISFAGAVLGFAGLAAFSRSGSLENQFVLAGVFFIFAFAWYAIVTIRYALTPMAAALEPNVKITQTLRRGRLLLGGRGQWFLVKGLLLVGAPLLIIAAFVGENLNDISGSDNPILFVLGWVIGVLAVGAPTMFYIESSKRLSMQYSQGRQNLEI